MAPCYSVELPPGVAIANPDEPFIFRNVFCLTNNDIWAIDFVLIGRNADGRVNLYSPDNEREESWSLNAVNLNSMIRTGELRFQINRGRLSLVLMDLVKNEIKFFLPICCNPMN